MCKTHARIRRRKTVKRVFERHIHANNTLVNTSTVADQLNSGKTRDGTKEMTYKTCRRGNSNAHTCTRCDACVSAAAIRNGVCWSECRCWLADWQLKQQQARFDLPNGRWWVGLSPHSAACACVRLIWLALCVNGCSLSERDVVLVRSLPHDCACASE